jgi:hypothetical protein
MKAFHEASIFTFRTYQRQETLHKVILERAGSRYLMHDPTTWPKQANWQWKGVGMN